MPFLSTIFIRVFYKGTPTVPSLSLNYISGSGNIEAEQVVSVSPYPAIII